MRIKRTRRRARPLLGTYRGQIVQSTVRGSVYPPISEKYETIGALDMTRWRGTEVTTSENHPAWLDRKSGRFQGDLGGEFYSQKQFVDGEIAKSSFSNIVRQKFNGDRDYDLYRYMGPVLPLTPSSMLFPPLHSGSSNASLDAWGTKAIAACKPTNPAADTAVFLGELLLGQKLRFASKTLEVMKEVIGGSRALSYKSKRLRKAPAEDFLLYQYGLKPAINDAMKIAATVLEFGRLARQLERDSGKLVRRRFEFTPVVTRDFQEVSNNADPYIIPSSNGLRRRIPNNSSGTLVPPTGKVYRDEVTTIRRWFSGAFTYYVPPDYSSDGSMEAVTRRVLDNFGLAPTPDTIWNLAPWSWAVDWFSSAGAVISNWTDMINYGLTLRYGYVMEHTVTRRTFTYAGVPSRTSGYPKPFTLVSETKIRRRATPFGFGLTWDGFSPLQLAIAAALGISRS